MPETDSPKRTARFPFAYGDIVYHRARTTKVPGVVIGFVSVEHASKILVRWGNTVIEQDECHFCELTTEYQPNFLSES